MSSRLKPSPEQLAAHRGVVDLAAKRALNDQRDKLELPVEVCRAGVNEGLHRRWLAETTSEAD